jgi:hypothetical protein
MSALTVTNNESGSEKNSAGILVRVQNRKEQIGNKISNAMHNISYALKTYAGYSLPHPGTYQEFPFRIGDITINSSDCLSCDRWVYFASFSQAMRAREKTANNLERFCVVLLDSSEDLLDARKDFIDLEARSEKLHRAHDEFLAECQALRSPDFVLWVAFNTSCAQLTEKEHTVTKAFELYKNRKHSVIEVAQQAQKAEASLKARKVSVKDAKMNELLLYMPGFVKESVSFNKDIAAKLGVYESHLEIVRAALKKLLDSQEFEID